jgi:ABC-type phosphate transport system substrate-binding protein
VESHFFSETSNSLTMKLYCCAFLTLLSILASPATATCITDELTVAGSTTVYPVAVEWAYGYKTNCTQSNVTVDWELGGSTVGAKRVCGDPAYAPVQIGTMSRQMKSTEAVKQADGRSFKFPRSIFSSFLENFIIKFIVPSLCCR